MGLKERMIQQRCYSRFSKDLGTNAAKEKKTDSAKRGGKEERGGDETKGHDEELLQLTITGQSLSIRESLCSLSLSKEYQL